LINQHRQVLSQQLWTAFLEKKFDSPVITLPLGFLSIRLIAYAIAITNLLAGRCSIDASLTPRKTECPTHFAVIGQLFWLPDYSESKQSSVSTASFDAIHIGIIRASRATGF
jgi:hypothetical protein